MKDPTDKFGISHDGYLKLYQLSKPRLTCYNCILIDEAQVRNSEQICLNLYQNLTLPLSLFYLWNSYLVGDVLIWILIRIWYWIFHPFFCCKIRSWLGMNWFVSESGLDAGRGRYFAESAPGQSAGRRPAPADLRLPRRRGRNGVGWRHEDLLPDAVVPVRAGDRVRGVLLPGGAPSRAAQNDSGQRHWRSVFDVGFVLANSNFEKN